MFVEISKDPWHQIAKSKFFLVGRSLDRIEPIGEYIMKHQINGVKWPKFKISATRMWVGKPTKKKNTKIWNVFLPQKKEGPENAKTSGFLMIFKGKLLSSSCLIWLEMVSVKDLGWGCASSMEMVSIPSKHCAVREQNYWFHDIPCILDSVCSFLLMWGLQNLVDIIHVILVQFLHEIYLYLWLFACFHQVFQWNWKLPNVSCLSSMWCFCWSCCLLESQYNLRCINIYVWG